jgi:hypothetical protein
VLVAVVARPRVQAVGLMRREDREALAPVNLREQAGFRVAVQRGDGGVRIATGAEPELRGAGLQAFAKSGSGKSPSSAWGSGEPCV